MSNGDEKTLWYEVGLKKLLFYIGGISLLITTLITGVSYVSNISPDSTKLILSLLNLLFALVFCFSLSKRKELKFKNEESKLEYWDLLDVQSRPKDGGKEIEIGNKKYDGIERSDFNEKRVNLLVHQYTKHIFWFALILVVVYLTFTLDNPLILGKNLDTYHPTLKIFEDLSNFGNSIFIFLGFMVLYDKTIDKKNNENNYYMPVAVITIIFLFVYGALVAFPTLKYANNASDIIRNIKDKTNNKTSFGLIISINKMTESPPENEDAKNELIKKLKSIVESNSILEKEINGESPLFEELKIISEAIEKDRPKEFTLNIMQLIIGCFNGLSFALLFGRYISMEHQLWSLKEGIYSQFIKWGMIIILPVYALVQPLFGSFEINVFGSPKNFTNIVFFICLVGKGFFFYVTWLFIEKRLMHYCLHLALINHGVPRDFDTCFEKDEK